MTIYYLIEHKYHELAEDLVDSAYLTREAAEEACKKLNATSGHYYQVEECELHGLPEGEGKPSTI